MLLDLLDGGDMKAQIACGHALGRIGPRAITPLIAEYGTSAPTRRALILFAFGKIRSPQVLKAVPLAIEAMLSPDLELRDTATRALGKFAEVIPAGSLSGDLRLAVVERLRSMAREPNPSLRAKAVRALGKLAKCGHLTSLEQEGLETLCTAIVGTDGAQNWDRAYIVRKEAEEALRAIRTVSTTA
jgi:HEAT repeat protein